MWLVVVFICLVFLGIFGCARRSERIEFFFTKDAELRIITAENDTLFFDIEIADTPHKRNQGLMFRYSMEPNQGMLFVFDYPDIQSFWMRNTYISLDIIFIDEHFRIVYIHENAFPLCEEPIFYNQPTKYVLELLGGVAERKGIGVGDEVGIMR